MVVARSLTRGVGERIQIRELRSSQYPQTGLRESIIPDAVNTSVVSTDVMAIRVNNHFEPSLINSWQAFFNRVDNPLNIPFLGLSKGTNGYGLTYRNWQPSLNTGNVVTAQTLVNGLRIPVRVNQTHINSFGTTPFANKGYNNIVFSNNGVNLLLVDNFGNLLRSPIILNRASRKSDFVDTEKFEVIKGGVTIPVLINKDGKIWDYVKFKRFVNQSFTLTPHTENIFFNARFYNNYRVSNVEPYATLTYSETNTNQNNNVSWLLNQRTQYRRKFNPLKNLGV